MATVMALRGSSSLRASPASTSSVCSSHPAVDYRHRPQIFASSRASPCASSFPCPPCASSSRTSLISSLSSSTVCASSSSGANILREAAKSGGECWRRSVAASSPRCETESNADADGKIPFGYTRKDVIAIGVGLLAFGIGLKYGLELLGVDSIRAGNAVQLIMVLGLTIGWISTYVFRVSSKEMTYAKQLKEYENKVMQKRLEEMPEAELESMLAQVEEDKRTLKENRDKLRGK